MTYYLLLVAVAALTGLAGAWWTQRRYENLLATARAERRAAQHETAKMLAKQDRLIRTGIEARGGILTMYHDWWDDAEDLEIRLAAAENTVTELSDFIRERGMYDDAVAAAHDAEIVEDTDPIEDTPMLRELEATMPVSPAPSYDFAAPTGSWAFIDIRPAIGSAPAADIDAAIDALVERVAA